MLNQNAKENLINDFIRYKQNPTQEHFAALLATQETLTSMVSGHAAPVYYLSSLDPGMGKTTAIIAWLKAYIENPEAYGNQGVLIAVERYEEIQRWIEDCCIPENRFAVRVSDESELGIELNNLGLGRHRRHEALVLFTTKKQVRNRGMVDSFNSVKSFHFNGQPRRVKVWDETFTLGEDVILNPCNFGALLTQLDSTSPELVDKVLKTVDEMRQFKGNGTYFMPELPNLPDNFEQGTNWDTLHERTVAGHLLRMSGQPVSIHSDGRQRRIVDSSPKLPDDFAPCLILDASARVRATYDMQGEAHQNIKYLPKSHKSYRRLDVRVWERKSGKHIINDIKQIVPELAALLMEHQGEDFLIILHKGHRVAFKRALSKELSRDHIAKVKFCTWARHTATNEFSAIHNIVMLSPFQMPDYKYEAIARAATATTTAKGKPSQEQISRVKKGEIASDILQAVSRGKVRKAEGDACPHCRLWLIAHPSTGIAAQLPTIFPECKIMPWNVREVQLTSSNQRITFTHLQELIKQGVTEVLAKTVRENLGFKDSGNFTRLVLKQPTFAEALARTGWEYAKQGVSYVFRKTEMMEAV